MNKLIRTIFFPMITNCIQCSALPLLQWLGLVDIVQKGTLTVLMAFFNNFLAAFSPVSYTFSTGKNNRKTPWKPSKKGSKTYGEGSNDEEIRTDIKTETPLARDSGYF